MRIAFSASRRRFWVAVGGGLSGLALFGAARLHNRHQQLLRPGPLPEESEGVGPLDTLFISAQLGGSSLSIPWDPHAVTRWVSSSNAQSPQDLVASGIHRVILSCLKDAVLAGRPRDDPSVLDAVRALAVLLGGDPASRRHVLNAMGCAHWTALAELFTEQAAAEEATRALRRVLSSVAEDMLSRTDATELYDGLALSARQACVQASSGAHITRHSTSFSLGLRASGCLLAMRSGWVAGASFDSPDPRGLGDAWALVLPVIGLALVAHTVGSAGLDPTALTPAGAVLSSHAESLAASKDALPAAAASLPLARAWMRVFAEAAGATARAAHSRAGLSPTAGSAHMETVTWLGIGYAVLAVLAALAPDERDIPPGDAQHAVACVKAATAVGSLLALMDGSIAEQWGRLATPALHAFALGVMAPVALDDCYDRPLADAVRSEHVVGLCTAITSALAVTLRCFPPRHRCDAALLRPTPTLLKAWLHRPLTLSESSCELQHRLLVSPRDGSMDSASPATDPGLAAAAATALSPADILPLQEAKGLLPSPSDRVSSAFDEDAVTAVILGLPGTVAPLAEDAASLFPSPQAQLRLRRAYGPVISSSSRCAFARGASLAEFPVLRRSRVGGAGTHASNDDAATLTVLPSVVDLLCGLTRNLAGSSAGDAATAALASLLVMQEASTDADAASSHSLAHGQVLVAQAWLASILRGALDVSAHGASGGASPRALVPPAVASSATRELLRWIGRHTERLPLTPAQTGGLPLAPWQPREGTPVDLLPHFVFLSMLSPAIATRAAVNSALAPQQQQQRVPVFDELVLPFAHASSALHVHLCKALAFLPAVPRDRGPKDSGVQGPEPLHLAASLALRIAEQGALHPLLFLAQFYASGLATWQRAVAGGGVPNSGAPPRPSLRLQMDPQYNEAVSALRQCLRLGANVAYSLRPPDEGEADAPDARSAWGLREAWAASAALWRAPCEDADRLEDLKAHCHAVRLLSNLAALKAQCDAPAAVRHHLPYYGDNIAPLLPLPPRSRIENRSDLGTASGAAAHPRSPIDIVFVHGLQGAGLKTWRAGTGWCVSHAPDDDGFHISSVGGVAASPSPRPFPFYVLGTRTHPGGRRIPIWPALWLGPDLAALGLAARPLVVTYDSDVWSAQSVRPLRSLDEVAHELCCQLRDAGVGVAAPATAAPAPVVFVGHSMGGLVIKHILREAGQVAAAAEADHPMVSGTGLGTSFRLAEATAGVAFIGTPHAGSQVASRALWICRHLSNVHRWIPGAAADVTKAWAAPMLGTLREDNESLAALDAQFLRLLQGGKKLKAPMPLPHGSRVDSSAPPVELLRRGCERVAVLSLAEGSALPIVAGAAASDAAAGAATPLGPVHATLVDPTAVGGSLPPPSGGGQGMGTVRGLLNAGARPLRDASSIVVVPVDSACPGYGLCARVDGADHVQVCKPDAGSPGDARYSLVHALVREAARPPSEVLQQERRSGGEARAAQADDNAECSRN